MSQEKLAEKVGVRRSTISDFENGKRSLGSDTLEEIIKILDLGLYKNSEVILQNT